MAMNEEHPLHMLDNQADPATKPKVILQKSIRTYEGDVAEAMAGRKTSVMSMAIAESSKKTGADTISNSDTESKGYGKKIATFLLSILLIAAGLGGGYYLYLKSPLAQHDPPAVNNKIPSIVVAEKQIIVSLQGLDGNQTVRKINNSYINEDIPDQTIFELIFSQTVGSTTVRVGTSAFLDKFNFEMPDTLRRSLKDSWMFGIHATDGTKNPFILLKNDFFQNTYAGMLKWESSMPEELADILNYRNLALQQDPMSTSSISQFFNLKGSFEDRTIMNRDVREFRNQNGDLLLLYSFIDKDTLIITTSEATLKIVIEKIEKLTYIR
jgi:hypothetical protein